MVLSRRKVSAAAGVLVISLGLIACGDDDKSSDTSTAASAPAAQPTILSITTTDAGGGKFAMKAPSTIKGGLVEIRFTNASKAPHEAQLIRLDGSHPLKDALPYILTNGPAKIPAFIHGEGGVPSTPPGKSGSAFTNLPAGHYGVIDDETGDDDKTPPPSKRGALAEFDVTPGTDGQLPQTQGKVTVVDKGKDEYEFQTSGLKAGTNRIEFDNNSKEALHHVVAIPIKGNATIAEAKKAFTAKHPTGPPPLDFSGFTGTEVIDPGRSEVSTLHLRKGRYALICFLNDRDDLKPHFEEGLFKEVIVP